MSNYKWFVAAFVATVIAPLVAVLTGSPASAVDLCASGEPPAGLTKYEWDGTAGDGDWDNAANWTVTGPGPDRPNYFGTPATDTSETGYVCVNPVTSTTITLDDEVNVHVVSIDVGPNVILAVGEGARVWVYGGDAQEYVSRIHSDATVKLDASTLGGPGLIELDGTLNWRSLATGAATLDNDFCTQLAAQAVEACPVSTTGLLRIENGGRLRVPVRGVNLQDGYRIEIASGGRLKLLNQGYIAADRDTGISIEPGGVFEFANDGSVFEGFANGETMLASFVNEGTLHKSDGSGISAINATYSGDGAVLVDSGTLTITDGTGTNQATLRPGASLGTASCKEAATCVPKTTATDVQNAVITPALTAPAAVSITEEASVVPGDVLAPITIEAPQRPSTIRFEYNKAELQGRDRQGLSIFYRRPDVGLVKIPHCRTGGDIPKGEVRACVVRRQDADTGLRVTVRAMQPAGRWSLRPATINFVKPTDPLVGAPKGCMVAWPSYPHVATSEEVWLREPGRVDIRFSSEERTDNVGKLIRTLQGDAGRNPVNLPIERSGWVAAVVRGEGESSGSFRVMATPEVDFLRMSEKTIVGRKVVIKGDLDPGGRRDIRLYVSGPGSRFLEGRSITTRTDRQGNFTIAFTPKRRGEHEVAVYVSGAGGLSAAISNKAIEVFAKRRPKPDVYVPPPTVTQTVAPSQTTTVSPPPLYAIYPRSRALGCRYQVR